MPGAAAPGRCAGSGMAVSIESAFPLVEVHASPDGDVLFPDVDLSAWAEVEREELPRSEKDDVTATLRVLDRKT